MRTQSRFEDFTATKSIGDCRFVDEVTYLQSLNMFPWELLNKIHEQSILDDMKLLFNGLYRRVGALIYHLQFVARDNILQMLLGTVRHFDYTVLLEQVSDLEAHCLRYIRRIAVYLHEASKLYLSKDLIDNINAFDKYSWFYSAPQRYADETTFSQERFLNLVDEYITEKLLEEVY